ncbi:hypothetical protein K502DRAFT_322502 [Neoconidiobolus thromboides FSU 785]|nr:hypothetical protein K502DRAFT_322502 [Neoconidiobolus thromboides FSU 785]
MNNPNQGSGPPNQNSGQSTSGIFKAAKKRYQPGVQSTNIIIPKAESFDRHSSENSPSSISFPPAPQPNPIVPSFGDPSKIPQFGNFNVQNTARPGFPPRTVSNIEKGSPSFAPSSTTFGSSKFYFY